MEKIVTSPSPHISKLSTSKKRGGVETVFSF
jgi:hypothetical protein